MHEKHVARETYLESPGRNMMEPFCKRTKDFKPSAVFAKKKKNYRHGFKYASELQRKYLILQYR